MGGEGIKHWVGTGLVAIAAGFVIFGLAYGQDFLKDFFKEQERKIELESELIEQEENSIENESSQNKPIPFHEAVILATPLAVPIITLAVSPTQIPQNISSGSMTPTAIPTLAPVLLSTQEPSPATTFIPSSEPTPSSTPFPTLAPLTPTPVQQQAQLQCQTGQVDINSAPKEELIKIIHIGDARAKELITLRPFSSVDDLDRIKGIGPARIQDIKNEGIACIR